MTSDKDGDTSVFERELPDADVVISQPFWPAYLTAERIQSLFLIEEMERVKQTIGEEAYQAGRFADAIALYTELSMADELQPFLTLAAYRLIT